MNDPFYLYKRDKDGFGDQNGPQTRPFLVHQPDEESSDSVHSGETVRGQFVDEYLSIFGRDPVIPVLSFCVPPHSLLSCHRWTAVSFPSLHSMLSLSVVPSLHCLDLLSFDSSPSHCSDCYVLPFHPLQTPVCPPISRSDSVAQSHVDRDHLRDLLELVVVASDLIGTHSHVLRYGDQNRMDPEHLVVGESVSGNNCLFLRISFCTNCPFWSFPGTVSIPRLFVASSLCHRLLRSFVFSLLDLREFHDLFCDANLSGVLVQVKLEKLVFDCCAK